MEDGWEPDESHLSGLQRLLLEVYRTHRKLFRDGEIKHENATRGVWCYKCRLLIAHAVEFEAILPWDEAVPLMPRGRRERT